MLDTTGDDRQKQNIERLSKSSEFPALLDYLLDQSIALAFVSLEQEPPLCFKTQGGALIIRELYQNLKQIRGE